MCQLNDGAETAVGVLETTVNTFNKDLGATGTHVAVGGSYGWHGEFYDALLYGENALIKADLPSCVFN